MNRKFLNTVNLDGEVIIKKGSGGGGGGVPINNQSKSVEFTENGTSEVRYDAGYTGLEKVSVKVAIPVESKSVTIVENGTTEVVADKGFLNKVIVNTNVASSGGDTPSRPSWTGHADAEGLRAIGWTDEDIAYYQANGVNWNAEDDEYHKVTDDNKALYGVLTADNISTYAERIMYLPKIDTSTKTSMHGMFSDCKHLVGLPMLDTSNVTDIGRCFEDCKFLICVPPFDTSNVTDMNSMFKSCIQLKHVPPLDINGVKNFNNIFYGCVSLEEVVFSGVSGLASLDYSFCRCASLKKIVGNIEAYRTSYTFDGAVLLASVERLDFLTNNRIDGHTFYENYFLEHLLIDNLNYDLYVSNSILLSKESLLHIINNEAASSSRTIQVNKFVYEKLASDADIVAALANHPNISLSK